MKMRQDLERRPPRMVGYGRVSTGEEKQLYSLENQLLFFTEFAQAHRYELVRVYADEGISGKQLKKRDEFLNMLRDAEQGGFDVVVVKDVSRFARNTVDLLTSIRRLKAMGVNVLFVNNNQQTLGESEFVITLLGAVAQEESANLSKRVQFGKDVTARRGRVPKRILGYDYIDNYTLKINEGEAALVRRIYSMYVSGGYGMAAIAAALREEGSRTKLGCDYTEGYIRRILTNPIYCGDLVNHKTQITDYINGVRKSVPDDERYHHERPELAIVSRGTFDKARRIREERRQMQLAGGGGPRRRYTSRYMFSGLVRCGVCGCTMYRQNVPREGSGRVDGYWRCKNGTRGDGAQCGNRCYVPDSVLKRGLAGALRECVQDEGAFAGEVWEQRQLDKARGRPVEDRAAERRQAVEKLRKQKRKYLEMYVNNVLTMDELKELTGRTDSQIERLEQELARLSRDAGRDGEGFEGLPACAADVKKFLELEDVDNAAVRKILDRIVVKPDRTLTFLFKTG